MIEIGDLVELTVDLPERDLRAGERGTVVYRHTEEDYGVEFANEFGETLDFVPLHTRQFILVWRAETHQPVPAAEQAADLIAHLPAEAAQTVLEFARFLATRQGFETISLGANRNFEEIIARSRRRHQLEGGVSSDEVRRMFQDEAEA
jgi:hypothetical protein